MRKIYKTILSSSFAVVITIITANSQPTLTAANNNPVAGDVFKIYDATLPLIATVQLAGANQTWDFSNLIGYDSTTYTYIDATTTPYYNLAPTATVAIYYPSQSFYNYYSGTANDFSYLGGTSGNPNSIYSDPYKYYSYPFTYQSSFLDTFITSSSTCYSTHTADGYGTLIMPYGTVNNVLRHYEHTDIYAATDTTHEDFYYWLLPGTHWAVCNYGNVYHTAGTLYTFFNYLVPSATGFNDLASINTSIDCFPNPFSCDLTLTIRNKNISHGNISVKNPLGQIVFSESEINLNSSLAKTIDMSFLHKGIYLLEVIIDGERTTRKMVKQ